MRNLLVLLGLLICIVAYVRDKQPATWNSWMVAVGDNSLVISSKAADSDAPDASSTPDAPTAPPPEPAPARVVPVGGLLKNGNFVGSDNWQGDGEADPSGKGLIVRLNPSSWTRVYQTFPDQGASNSIEVTYKFSPGLTVSTNPADYTDISKRLQVDGFENFSSLGISPGQFYGTIGDPSGKAIAMEVYSPDLKSTDVQDYQHAYPPIPASGSTTFILAFPPGTGTVTLLTAYVTSSG